MTAAVVGTTVAERTQIHHLVMALRVFLDRGADVPAWVTDRLAEFDYHAVKREMAATLHNDDAERVASLEVGPNGCRGGAT